MESFRQHAAWRSGTSRCGGGASLQMDGTRQWCGSLLLAKPTLPSLLLSLPLVSKQFLCLCLKFPPHPPSLAYAGCSAPSTPESERSTTAPRPAGLQLLKVVLTQLCTRGSSVVTATAELRTSCAFVGITTAYPTHWDAEVLRKLVGCWVLSGSCSCLFCVLGHQCGSHCIVCAVFVELVGWVGSTLCAHVWQLSTGI